VSGQQATLSPHRAPEAIVHRLLSREKFLLRREQQAESSIVSTVSLSLAFNRSLKSKFFIFPCFVKLIALLLLHACVTWLISGRTVAKPGHWFGLVTWLGWLDPVQLGWARSSP